MKILPCKNIFKKSGYACFVCDFFGEEKYCYGLLYYIRLLKYLLAKIIYKIKVNIKFYFRNTDDLPF